MKFTFLTTTKGRIVAALVVSIIILVLGACLVLNAARKGLQQGLDETGLNRAVIESAFDPQKQKRLLRAESLVFEADRYAEQKKYKLAHDSYEDAVDDLTETLGADATIVCTIKSVQARFEQQFQKYDLSEKLYRQALSGFEKNKAFLYILPTQRALAFVLMYRDKNKESVAMAIESLHSAKRLDEMAHSKMYRKYFYELEISPLNYGKTEGDAAAEAEFNNALALARKVHADNNVMSRRLDDVADCRMEHDDYTAAIKLYTEAIDLDSNADNYSRRGYAYGLNKDYSHAIEDLTTALKTDPDSSVALAERAQFYDSSGNQTAAIADYSKVIDMTPVTKDSENDQIFTCADALNGRGQVYMAMHKPDLAIKDYTRAIEISPGSRGEAYQLRAKAYESMNKPDLAKKDQLAAKADQAKDAADAGSNAGDVDEAAGSSD